ncbi:hypothetical protein QPL30_23745 [Escherichia coli]|nr:hypothetical protein [Escherichia coli]MDS1619974.1 hypothetical protein [Escherichia coli]
MSAPFQGKIYAPVLRFGGDVRAVGEVCREPSG